MAKIFKLGDVFVAQYNTHTTTVFPDGARITGTREVQPDQTLTAKDYGIDASEMNRTHDLTHSVLAALLGLPASPSLYNTAHKRKHPDWWVEERAVLALQAYASTFGVDMEGVAQRLEALQVYEKLVRATTDSVRDERKR